MPAAEGNRNRPNLLFLTPTLPYTTGTGSSIRAGVTLAALARHFNVYVLHAELWGWHAASFKTNFVREHSVRYIYYVPQNGEIPIPQILAGHFAGIRFQAVHAFRLVMAPAAVSALLHHQNPQPLAVLDLDDDECQRSERFVVLRDENGDATRAQIERKELVLMRNRERMLIPRFQTVCLAALKDCSRIVQRYPGPKVVHLPNAIFLPREDCEAPCVANSASLLFVGTLNYLPNEDGIHYFCTRILPLVREKFAKPVRLQVVGAHPGPRVRGLSRDPDVEVLANVPNLAPYYTGANMAIVPLRAGSGTRIKILEAFSFRRTVVSTTIGAEGLGVENGRQLFIADEPEAFAGACVRLLEDPELAANMSAVAWEWLLESHSVDAVEQVILSLYAPVLFRAEEHDRHTREVT